MSENLEDLDDHLIEAEHDLLDEAIEYIISHADDLHEEAIGGCIEASMLLNAMDRWSDATEALEYGRIDDEVAAFAAQMEEEAWL